MNWLKRFMVGRYGTDQLSMALMVLSLLLLLISGTFRTTSASQQSSLSYLSYLSFIAYVPFAWALFRMLSKNRQKRIGENRKFSILAKPVYSWVGKQTLRFKDRKNHIYFKCPGCRSQLRVPRNKGKIRVTCPKCKKEFIKSI